MQLDRRFFVSGGLAVLTGPALAQTGHQHHDPLYELLRQPGRIGVPEAAAQQRVYDSPAPKAASAGRWLDRAPLPLPRSEMAWAAEHAGRMHLVGGYGEQRVDRPYHHVYDPASDRWLDGGAAAARREPCRRRRRRRPDSTPSAASSSRTASRTTNASCGRRPRTPGARSRRCRAPAARSAASRVDGQAARGRRRDRRHLRDQALGRLAPRLRPGLGPLGEPRAAS